MAQLNNFPITNSPQISVIIPVKDEERNLSRLIESVRQEMAAVNYQVIVVDDGSTDRTLEIARQSGAIVIAHDKNMGKGAAMKTGARAATGQIIVFIDGDGAHRPSDILKVVSPVQQGVADIVNGSRHLPGSIIPGAPLRRRVTNTMASMVISITVLYLLPAALWLNRLGRKTGKSPQSGKPGAKTWFTDCTSGFRATTKTAWEALPLVSDGFEIETEMIFEAVKNGIRLVEVPITCNWDSSSSKLSIVRDGLKTIRLLVVKVVGTTFRG